VEHGPGQRLHLPGGQTCERQLLGKPGAPHVAHQRPQGRLDLGLIAAVGADQEHAPVAHPACQVVQQLHRGRVRPVQVVQGQRHWRHGLEQAGALQGGIAERRGWRQVQAHEQPPQVGQAVEQPDAAARRQRHEVGPERLEHRCIRQTLAEHPRAARERHEAPLPGHRQRLADQSGLPDPRRTGEHQHRPAPIGRALHRHADPSDLG
jgi:hypothetical protein